MYGLMLIYQEMKATLFCWIPYMLTFSTDLQTPLVNPEYF